MPVIRKSKVLAWATSLIDKAVKKAEESFERQKIILVDSLNFEHSLAIKEKDIEIAALKRELASLNKKSSKAEAACRTSKEQIKLNMKLTQDVIFHVKELFEGTAEIYQTFSILTDQAEQYNKLLEDTKKV